MLLIKPHRLPHSLTSLRLNTHHSFSLAISSNASKITSATTTSPPSLPRRSGKTYILFTFACPGNSCSASGHRPPQHTGSSLS